MDLEDIENRFKYHPPKDDNTVQLHQSVREITRQVAVQYNKLPEGREKALAMTKLEEAMFWANAAIARNSSA